MKRLTLCLLAGLLPSAAHAQSDDAPREPRRYRVVLGAEVSPSFPGARRMPVQPLWDYSIARGDTPFAFDATDDSPGFTLAKIGGVEFGGVFDFQNGRDYRRAGIQGSGDTLELGGFAQAMLAPWLRAHVELRRGINGHDAWTGNAGLDLIQRDGDKHVFAIGPRLTFGDARYQRAFFGVTPAESAASGLTAFAPDGGIHAVGANAGYLRQFGRHWGLYSYLKYDRLTGSAAESPLVRAEGSRNQLSAGLALSVTFGGKRS
ncbi:MipA/OmpV family protein [Sphingomonas sp.]|uniref:MipA/OmpV family protein n=1 Tax=Sphingomonas sp. TaxID=28214 RepID=UPI001B17EEDC|nr:MipA/OmpV family protein [Sphingomonas sp.]MBO9712590.1 MipA/OmpV family protein [Sphingomonas sp.]